MSKARTIQLEDITICIPSRRPEAEPFLAQALKSCAFAGVAEVLCLRDYHNDGAGHTRNKLLNGVRTEWVRFLDADDHLIAPWMMDGTLDADLIISPVKCFYHENRQFDADLRPVRFNQLSVEDMIEHGVVIHPNGMLWKTESLRDLGEWEHSLQAGFDIELFARALWSSLQIEKYCDPTAIFRYWNNPVGYTSARKDEWLTNKYLYHPPRKP